MLSFAPSRQTARAFIAAALFCATWVAGPASAEGGRLALVIGQNLGLSDEQPLRYAESDALKIERVLRDLGGYRDDEIRTVVQADADAVRRAFSELHARAERENPDVVFVYYSGHGDGKNLHLDDSRLPFAELREALDALPARVRIAVIDACNSGAMIRAKGAAPGPSFDIDVSRDAGVAGSIVITSSSADEVAQESDRLEGSFFTHFLVSGLYGRADTNRDGLVTLEEAYRYAHFQTVSQTLASSGGVQHPSYRLDLEGEGSIVLAHLERASARIEIESSEVRGSYFILDAERGVLLTELNRDPGGRAGIRLPPGLYRIKKREAARLRVVDVAVSAVRRDASTMTR